MVGIDQVICIAPNWAAVDSFCKCSVVFLNHVCQFGLPTLKF